MELKTSCEEVSIQCILKVEGSYLDVLNIVDTSGRDVCILASQIKYVIRAQHSLTKIYLGSEFSISTKEDYDTICDNIKMLKNDNKS